MANKRIAALIKQEVQQPTATESSSHEIATTQNTPLAELQLASQGLFDESKALWQEFIAFDKEHQLTQRVGAQLWRLTKAVGKPALILSLKGIQTAVVTVVNADKRAALVERFSCFSAEQTTDASLETAED
ncbi:MAG: hypothetical protein HLUCCA11_19800 [Phormidesmis priestleyi Ana]|uniref:Uncharacterized protein n=1 Tax=Phormidesmis priestleyi Ana TaxID=1666911 RepID=A0A0P8BVV8_9CYAN|nr:MAG: hypothetical protein HLUCCA11_19800 [Phormidesmis priestleyi Ana]